MASETEPATCRSTGRQVNNAGHGNHNGAQIPERPLIPSETGIPSRYDRSRQRHSSDSRGCWDDCPDSTGSVPSWRWHLPFPLSIHTLPAGRID